MTDLVIPVPPQVRSTFAVPLPVPPADPGAVLGAAFGGLPDAVARVADRLVDAGALVVAQTPAAAAVPMTDDVLGLIGADPAQAALLRAVPEMVLVDAVGPPGDPGPMLAAAGVAAGVAVALSGGARVGLAALPTVDLPTVDLPRIDLPVIDLAGVRLVRPEQLVEALPGAGLVVRLVQWVQVLHSGGAGGLWFTTKGLGRFGLPELSTECVPYPLARGWGTVLNGLASVLVRRWYELVHGGDTGAEPAFAVLPAELAVGPADVVRAHAGPPGTALDVSCPVVAADLAGSDPVGRPGARVGLRLDPSPDLRADSFLAVVPPADHDGPATAFLEAVRTAVVGPPAAGDRVA